jgi:hypothetical protein
VGFFFSNASIALFMGQREYKFVARSFFDVD